MMFFILIWRKIVIINNRIMKRIIFTLLVCLICTISNAQTTYFNGSWTSGKSATPSHQFINTASDTELEKENFSH